jgi:hypothetical protein
MRKNKWEGKRRNQRKKGERKEVKDEGKTGRRDRR